MKKTLFLLLSVLLAFALVVVTVSCESDANSSKAEEKSEAKGEEFNDDVVKALQTKNEVVIGNVNSLFSSIEGALKTGSFSKAEVEATVGLKAADGVKITTADEIKAYKSDLSGKTPSKFKSVKVTATMTPGTSSSEGSKSLKFVYTTDKVTDKSYTLDGSYNEPIVYEALAVVEALTTKEQDTTNKVYTYTTDIAGLLKRIVKTVADGADIDGTAVITLSSGNIAVAYDLALIGSADGNTLVVDVTKLEAKIGAKTLFSVKGKVTFTLSSDFGFTWTSVTTESSSGDKSTMAFSNGSSVSMVVEDFEATFDKCVFSGSTKAVFSFDKEGLSSVNIEELTLTETIDGKKYAELDASCNNKTKVTPDEFINGLKIYKFAVDGKEYGSESIKSFIKAYIEKKDAENSKH